MTNFEVTGRFEDTFVLTIKCSVEGHCEITGESMIENAFEFYHPLTLWISQYLEESKKPLNIDFKINYFNSSSSKELLRLLETVKGYIKKGAKIHIKWFVKDWDDEMMEEIEDLAISAQIEIEVISIPD